MTETRKLVNLFLRCIMLVGWGVHIMPFCGSIAPFFMLGVGGEAHIMSFCESITPFFMLDRGEVYIMPFLESFAQDCYIQH